MSNRRKLRLPGTTSAAQHKRCPACGGPLGPLVRVYGRLDRLIEHTPDCPYLNPKGSP